MHNESKLTAVIITRNEERNIERCLLSLQGVADEIVVVDSHSSDATESICKRYPLRFLSVDWLGYAKTKNYANDLASFDFILSIDADEALSEELRKSLQIAKQKGLAGTYTMNRLTNYCGSWIRHTSWYPDTKLRLWNRKEGQWQGTIHETIVFDILPANTHLTGDILHYSYYTVKEHIEQTHRFTDMSAEEMYAQRKPFKWHKLFLSPIARFIKDYIIHAGFLDGYAGFTVSRINAYAAYLKYAKYKKLLHGN